MVLGVTLAAPGPTPGRAGAEPPPCTPLPPGPFIGYSLAASDGGVFTFGKARFAGSLAGAGRDAPRVVGMAAHPRGVGYWLATEDGAVHGYRAGSWARSEPGADVVAVAPTPSGDGVWLADARGGVFAFGDARFAGSAVDVSPRAPVVGMAVTPSGEGYWLAAADGGVFAFGDAAFFGSTGHLQLNHPVVTIAASPSGEGYWLAAADGGVFAFGDAAFFGSTGGTPLNHPVVGLAASPSGAGYSLVAADGGVFAFGDAPFFGSMGGTRLNGPVVALAGRPGEIRCAEWPPEDVPLDLRFALAASTTQWASDEEATFTLSLENRGGKPAYIERFDVAMVDDAGRVVWQPRACLPPAPAATPGARRVTPRERWSSTARYPTEHGYEAGCPKARVEPGSYQLTGTLTWCTTAYRDGDGWFCDQPPSTRLARMAVEVERPASH